MTERASLSHPAYCTLSAGWFSNTGLVSSLTHSWYANTVWIAGSKSGTDWTTDTAERTSPRRIAGFVLLNRILASRRV